jgi:hypothetical protein
VLTIGSIPMLSSASSEADIQQNHHRVPGSPPECGRLPGSALARFLELRGRRIVRACGVLWHSVPGHFLMSLPYHVTVNPDPEELRRIILDTGAFGVRFPSRHWTGLERGLYLRHRYDYDLESLHVKHRPRVRRGLQYFEVRPADKKQLLQQGRSLNLSTMARQGRYDPEFGEPRRWETFVEAAFACPEVSFPAAFAGTRLAAYMVTCRDQNWLHILHQMSRQEDLPNFPNHLLTYAITKQAANDDSLEAVCYGYMPLFAADGLHEYKLRFGYTLVPHRSVIQLHPVLNAVLNCSPARVVVKLARCMLAQSQKLETLEAVLEGARSSGPPIESC